MSQVRALKKTVENVEELTAFSADTTSKLDILGHDGNPLGVDGAEIGVLKETNQVRLRCLLKSHNSGRLESQVSLEILSDFTDQTLEGKLANEQFSRLLIAPDLPKSNSSRAITMGLLHSSSSRGRLPGSLGGKLFPGSLSSSCMVNTYP